MAYVKDRMKTAHLPCAGVLQGIPFPLQSRPVRSLPFTHEGRKQSLTIKLLAPNLKPGLTDSRVDLVFQSPQAVVLRGAQLRKQVSAGPSAHSHPWSAGPEACVRGRGRVLIAVLDSLL